MVGSIGGTIVIGALVVIFLILKRKRSNGPNQLPDFADDSRELLDKGPGGFKKIFGSKAPTYGGVHLTDLEKEYPVGLDDDFAYRGVSNSNNLDSVFRSSAGTSAPISGPGSSSASTKHHSRYNSTVNPLFTMAEDEAPVPEILEPYTDTTPPEFGALPESDEDFLFRSEPHGVWVGEETSNTSRLRFAEEF